MVEDLFQEMRVNVINQNKYTGFNAFVLFSDKLNKYQLQNKVSPDYRNLRSLQFANDKNADNHFHELSVPHPSFNHQIATLTRCMRDPGLHITLLSGRFCDL